MCHSRWATGHTGENCVLGGKATGTRWLGRAPHPSALPLSWNGGCRWLRGSRESISTGEPSEYSGYPLHVIGGGHRVPERAATSPGSHSGQMARFHNLPSLPACLPASLFFLVPWRALNSQVCQARGGWAGSLARGLPGRPHSIGETGNKAPGLGARHFPPCLQGGGCPWLRAHIPPASP